MLTALTNFPANQKPLLQINTSVHKEGPLGPNILIFTSPVKTGKDFSPFFFFFVIA